MEAIDLGLFETLSFGEPVTITYDYDPLYRLTAADYDTGEFFHYTYDAVGNRLTQDTHEASNTYLYDDANRLIDVDGVTLTWDDNGNLLSDGVSSYTYDHANRLSSAVQGADTYTFSYNGLGDRLSQTVNDAPANYTLDLVGGLTHVLSDGTTSYLNGVARIGELQSSGWQYHLSDALGSVRQLVDESGTLTQARGFEPFGDELEASSIATSAYAFAGEWTDGTGLVHLRARYYAPWQGRFVSRDVWEGDTSAPMSFNPWLYSYARPLIIIDPSGKYPVGPEDDQGYSCEPPSIDGYNAAIRPRCISWNPSIQVKLASGIPENAFEAQYYIYELDPKTGKPVVNPLTGEREIPIAGAYGTRRCGQIALSMILETETGQAYQLQKILAAMKIANEPTNRAELGLGFEAAFPKGQGWHMRTYAASEFATYFPREDPMKINIYERTTQLDTTWWRGLNGDDLLARKIRDMLRVRHYVIALTTQSAGRGVLVPTGGVGHWVVVTGFSAKWSSNDNSRWNWVRINNPFNNREEYYHWPDFKTSMSSASGNLNILEIWKDSIPVWY